MITHKIFGPPGTGKTTRLMQIVENEVKQGTPLHRIGYLSFSVSAAEVIKERMKASASDVRWFKTIHAASLKSMGMGGAVIDYSDYAAFSARHKMFISMNEDEINTGFNPAMRVYQLACNTMRSDAEVIREMTKYHDCLVPRQYETFKQAWADYKKEVRKFDFMDMLIEYDRSGAPLPLDVMVLDEGQDLSAFQWKIFRKMIANCQRVYMAGDDDQAIFGFIGGSEYGFLEYPADEEEVLHQSYRVPRKIGDAADKVIRKIEKRKEKNVTWKRAHGEIVNMNLEPFMMPWREYIEKFDDIMVVARHRKGARAFSQDLTSIAIPHNFEHDTIQSWKEAKFVHDFFALKAGEQITVRRAQALLAACATASPEIEAMATRKKVSAKQLPLDFAAWPFVGNHKRYAKLRQFVNRDGWATLAKPPKISISTMHGAKGREADLVIVLPDCTTTVHENVNKATEVRLAYVAMTRAKKELMVMLPRDNFYIQHFFGR